MTYADNKWNLSYPILIFPNEGGFVRYFCGSKNFEFVRHEDNPIISTLKLDAYINISQNY